MQLTDSQPKRTMLYSQNKAYLFIPFSCGKNGKSSLYDSSGFQIYVSALQESKLWLRQKLKTRYYLKYITGKFDAKPEKDNTRVTQSVQEYEQYLQQLQKANLPKEGVEDNAPLDFENSQCFRFVLNSAEFEKQSPVKLNHFYRAFKYHNQLQKGKYDFKITGVQLYCFSTMVNILAIQLEFSGNDPYLISNTEYVLKNADEPNIIINETVSEEKLTAQDKISFTDIFNSCIRVTDRLDYDIFFFSNPGMARANMLTLLEVPEKENYLQELYYLKKCYSDGYIYSEKTEDEDAIYTSSKDVIWGLSKEAAVCLICPEMGRDGFLKGYFYKNFQTQYLLLYILLLHQKYVLYRFLTEVNVRSSKDIASLEEYKDKLYRFETDFVFSCITEVPQYQNIYEKLIEVFSLKEMYEDVHEPLISLSEVRYKADEEQHQKQDKRINIILFVLSLLSIFSAWVDSYDFINSFFTSHFGVGSQTVWWVQTVIAALILLATGFLVYKFFALSKDIKKAKKSDKEK